MNFCKKSLAKKNNAKLLKAGRKTSTENHHKIYIKPKSDKKNKFRTCYRGIVFKC